MKISHKTYSGFQKATAVFMMLVLFWLTISTPFVWASQQELAKHQIKAANAPLADCEDEDSFGSNNIEEKVPNTNTLSEEFLHDHHTADCFFTEISTYNKSEDADSYHAFHGELLVPPPNFS